MSVSVEAAAAHDSLSDDKELIHTFEVLEFLCNYNLAYGRDPLIGCVLIIR